MAERWGRQGGTGSASAGPGVLCLIPHDARDLSVADVRRSYESVEIAVIVDRRLRERRNTAERRRDSAHATQPIDRRRIRSAAGRRVAERRARLEPLTDHDPLIASGLREGLVFVCRVPQSPQQLDDQETLRLITRLHAGDQDAFDSIYRSHLKRLYAYALAALEDPAEAEDAVQAAFLTMLEEISSYEVSGVPFRIWLFRVLRHQVLARLSRRGRTIVDSPEGIGERIESSQLPADELLIERLANQDFLAGIERLPMAQRQVLVLRFLLDLSVQEVASIVDSNVSAVTSIQHRALTTLRAELRQEAPATPRLEMRRRARPSPVLWTRLRALG